LASSAGNASTAGTSLSAGGSGNNDEWFFDYQAGLLHFIGTNLPNGVSFTGKSVYISGARYTGGFGVSAPGGGGSVGNLTISNVTISANASAVSSSANIIFSTTGTGAVQFTGNAIGLPSGNILQRPTTVNAGYLRFNTEFETIEVWDGAEWVQTSGGVITSDVLNGDGSTAQFALSANTTTTGVLVSINGTIQKPSTAYTVSNNSITFTEIPALGDSIEVRKLSGGTISVNYGNADVAAFLTTYPGLYSNVQVSALITTNGLTNYSNVNVAAYVTTNGLTNYSNVNVAAYVTTNGLTNYSNVNVAAYVTTNGLTNYSNVNVIAYTQTQSYTNYSNVNLSAYLGGAVTIGGNLTVNGNVFINGNSTIINANNLSINDSMIYLADDNPADTLDIGFVSAFTDAVRYQHTGLVRDATDGMWKLFANVVPEPGTTVNFDSATYANLQVGNLLVGSYRQPAVTGFGVGGASNPGGIQFGDPNLIGGRANIVVSSYTYITLHAVGNITYRAAEQHEFVNEVHATSDLYVDGNVFLAAGNNPSSRVNVHASTTSTSTTTGAVVVRGGVGIGGNLNVGENITTTGATITGFSNIRIASGSADSALQIYGNVSRGGAGYHDFLRVTSTASGATNPNKHLRLDGTGNLQIINSAYTSTILSLTDAGILSDGKGDVRSAPQNSQGGAYTLVVGDAGKHISITTGGVTVDASIFSVGDMVTVFNNSGSSQTITQGTSVTLRLAGTATTGNRTLAQYGIATLLCVTGGASPVFACTGAGLT
jgi:hypothetical protein